MASAIEIRTLGSETAMLLRLGMFSLSAACAVLLLMYGAPWAAMAAALAGAVVWVPWAGETCTCLQIHGDGSFQVVGTTETVAAQLDLAFSGWGFALLRLNTAQPRQVLLVAVATPSNDDARRFCRWLKLAPIT